MSLKVMIFGGIGTLVETSELQRRSFNEAFAEAGLSWHWDVADYAPMLAVPGGRNRIRTFAGASGVDISEETIAALHARKTEIFQEKLNDGQLRPRPGVRRLMDAFQEAGLGVAMASATSLGNIQELAEAAGLDLERFDVVMHRGLIDKPKPDPEVYNRCLQKLAVGPAASIAIEDSNSGLAAAINAGLSCVATPGQYTRTQDFSLAAAVLDSLGDPGNPAQALDGKESPPDGLVSIAWLQSQTK